MSWGFQAGTSGGGGGGGAGTVTGTGTANQLAYWTGVSSVAALGAATNGQIPIGSTGAAPVLASLTAGAGIAITPGAGSISIATTGLPSGTGTTNKVAKWTGTATLGDSSTSDTGAVITIAPAASVAGSPTLWTLTGPAHTGLANAEVTDVDVNLARTVTLAGGGAAIANQRAARIQAPTYAAGAAQTITKAATLSISGPPVAGANVVFGSTRAINVEAGETWLHDNLTIFSTNYFRIGNPASDYASGYALAIGCNVSNGEGSIATSNLAVGYTPLTLAASKIQMFNSFSTNEFILGRDNLELQDGLLRASNGFGANVGGRSLTLSSGAGLGSGDPGSVIFSFAPAGAPAGPINTRIDSLKMRGAIVPAAFTAAADTAGIDTFLCTQSGGAHTAANPRGGDLVIQLGAAGAGGTGRNGEFKILTGNLNLDAQTAKTMLYVDANKNVVSTAAPTNGQLLIGSSGNIPALATITAGVGISVTNGAGTITLATTGSVMTVVPLTDAATIAVDASLGGTFRVTLNVAGATRILGNPTNPTDGQEIVFELIQDGSGSRALTYDTKYAFGTDLTLGGVVLTTTIAARDFLRCKYNSTTDKWYIVSFVKGY